MESMIFNIQSVRSTPPGYFRGLEKSVCVCASVKYFTAKEDGRGYSPARGTDGTGRLGG